MSHSKRNTSLAFFTAHERAQLRSSWGSQSQRLTRDSFLPFGSCALCLLPCKDPVACTGGPQRVKVSDAVPGSNGATSDGADSRKRKRDESDNQDAGKLECHMFCRECAMSNLLAQRKELKRLERLGDAERVEQREDDARENDEAHTRAVEEFERVQHGLDVARAPTVTERQSYYWRDDKGHALAPAPKAIASGPSNSNSERGVSHGAVLSHENTKGRGAFELNEDEFLRVAQEDRQKARQALSNEKAAASKSALPSFWVPSLTPSEQKPGVNAAQAGKKAQPICPGSTPETKHSLSLKSLVTVRFTVEGDQSNRDARVGSSNLPQTGEQGSLTTKVCPACSRSLTNASRATLAKPCGHVVCGSCVSRFIVGDEGDVVNSSVTTKQKDLQCFVCSESLSSRKSTKDRKTQEQIGIKEKENIQPGLVEISSEGTGFASGGQSVIKVAGTAFQC